MRLTTPLSPSPPPIAFSDQLQEIRQDAQVAWSLYGSQACSRRQPLPAQVLPLVRPETFDAQGRPRHGQRQPWRAQDHFLAHPARGRGRRLSRPGRAPKGSGRRPHAGSDGWIDRHRHRRQGGRRTRPHRLAWVSPSWVSRDGRFSVPCGP